MQPKRWIVCLRWELDSCIARCYIDAMRNIKPTTVRLTDDDKAFVEEIKRRYGLTSLIQVIRLALRVTVEQGKEKV